MSTAGRTGASAAADSLKQLRPLVVTATGAERDNAMSPC